MITIEDSILVVIDVQGRLFTLVHDHEMLSDNLNRLIKASQILNIPILWTEQAPEKIGETIPQIKSLLYPVHKPITKYSFSAMGSPEFVQAIKNSNRRTVIIVGIETHVCVYQTARDLKRHGYEVHVVADAVSSRGEHNKTLTIERLCHEGVVINATEMVICELLQTAKHPLFRDVMVHIKR